MSTSEDNLLEDAYHTWVWGLEKGDKVWVAMPEPLAKAENFVIDFYDETGPSEHEDVGSIFMPYEMQIVNNWEIKSGNDVSNLITFQYTPPKKFGAVAFAFRCDHRDLASFARGRNSDKDVLPTRVFHTQEECIQFCRNVISVHFRTSLCDAILDALDKMRNRVKGVRAICAAEEERGGDDIDFASAIDKIMD